MAPVEYYARQVTLDDLKFASEGTDVYNSAYNTHGKTTMTTTGFFYKIN